MAVVIPSGLTNTNSDPADSDQLTLGNADQVTGGGNLRGEKITLLTLATAYFWIASKAIRQSSEVSNTISANAATVDLGAANHQTLDLAAATADVTITLTDPTTSAAGTILIKQDTTAARDITWSTTGTLVWLGTEPTWNGDATSSFRVVSWRFDGTDIYMAATDSGS